MPAVMWPSDRSIGSDVGLYNSKNSSSFSATGLYIISVTRTFAMSGVATRAFPIGPNAEPVY